MATSTLLLLPLELRNQIYLHVLSPTGFITLPISTQSKRLTDLEIVPYNPATGCSWPYPTPIKLSILRVCKQVYSEARGLFWHHNGLYLRRADYFLFLTTLDPFAFQLCTKLSHIQFSFDVFDGTLDAYHLDMAKALQVLVTWSNTSDSAIRTLELRLTNFLSGAKYLDKTYPLSLSAAISAAMLDRNLAIFKRTGGEAGFSKRVRKMLVLDLPPAEPALVPENEAKKMERVAREGLLLPHKPLVRLHYAFGGELWINRLLCWKDSVQLENKLDLLRENIKILKVRGMEAPMLLQRSG